MSDEAIDVLIAHGEHFMRIGGDAEGQQMLDALRGYKRLRAAARALIGRYESMPDGTLGHGLTNGLFFALRDALQSSSDGSLKR
jgi:hypothetical protein